MDGEQKPVDRWPAVGVGLPGFGGVDAGEGSDDGELGAFAVQQDQRDACRVEGGGAGGCREVRRNGRLLVVIGDVRCVGVVQAHRRGGGDVGVVYGQVGGVVGGGAAGDGAVQGHCGGGGDGEQGVGPVVLGAVEQGEAERASRLPMSIRVIMVGRPVVALSQPTTSKWSPARVRNRW
ncbi:hypothetical protein [Micromonospora sp. NPDC005161]